MGYSKVNQSRDPGVGNVLDVSRARIMGQVRKSLWAEIPRYLAMDKTRKTRTCLRGDLSSHRVSLVMGLDSLTLHIDGHAVWISPDLSSPGMPLVMC